MKKLAVLTALLFCIPLLAQDDPHIYWEFNPNTEEFDSDDHDIDYFYASRLTSDPVGSEIEDLHYHVLEPRTLRLSAVYKF